MLALTVTGVHYLAPDAKFTIGPQPSKPAATVARDGLAFIGGLEARPLTVPAPSIGPAFKCFRSQPPAGPVRLGTPPRSHGTAALLPITVQDSYAGAILIRGERLDGAGGEMGFADLFGIGARGHLGWVSFNGDVVEFNGQSFQTDAVLHAPVRSTSAQFALAASNAPGCWAVELDGYRFSEVFLVNLG